MKVGCDDKDRAQIIDLSEGLIPHLATPPVGGPGVCARCATWTQSNQMCAERAAPLDTGINTIGRVFDRTDSSGRFDCVAQPESLCENCIEVRDMLDREPLRLSVISLYRKPSRLRDLLTRYKGRDDPEEPFDPACRQVVRAMLGRYLLDHGDRLEETSNTFDGVVVVPSTHRAPPHPLEDLIDSLDLDLPRWSMLARGPGELDFRRPSRDGYQTVMSRKPARILLLDDVYTTGSRLNSAASALSQGGHRAVAALVLARRINVEYTPEARQLWANATADSFDWQTSPRTTGI